MVSWKQFLDKAPGLAASRARVRRDAPERGETPMLRTLHRWQHTLLSVFFDMPEDREPLKNRPLQNHPLQNRPLADFHSRAHQPRVLKAWQNSVGNFVARHTAHK